MLDPPVVLFSRLLEEATLPFAEISAATWPAPAPSPPRRGSGISLTVAWYRNVFVFSRVLPGGLALSAFSKLSVCVIWPLHPQARAWHRRGLEVWLELRARGADFRGRLNSPADPFETATAEIVEGDAALSAQK